MDVTSQIIVVVALTFVIHLITTLSYAVRIVGIRTGRIAVSFALFNVLVLVSRTSNSIQAPLLAKYVENGIHVAATNDIEVTFRLILVASTVATLIGILLIPIFQRVFTRAVESFVVHRSVPSVIMHGFSKGGLRHLVDCLCVPSGQNIHALRSFGRIPFRLLLANVVAVALLTVGVLASLYAGYLAPEVRVTALSLSPIINGAATILMFIMIDPYLSALTDDVVAGDLAPSAFRQAVIQMVAARTVGTIVAQLLFLPAASAIAAIARHI
ncbi:MAG: hypothetical protein A2289_17825 [Deltaproteobacteria bacterium RIFOXYA12_FULL_58_15]|nr:MAG: hypothetical protein A2289_17825 [Deltaproteobacteria bacterium RIFOXYA12_FULL_58_15]